MTRHALPTIADCTDCGACCTGQAALPIHLAGGPSGFVMLGVNQLPAYLRAELLAQTEAFMRDGFPADGTPCIWYDMKTKRCKHYEYRPTLCRDEVKPGDEACRRWRRMKGIDPTVRFRFEKGKLVPRVEKAKS